MKQILLILCILAISLNITGCGNAANDDPVIQECEEYLTMNETVTLVAGENLTVSQSGTVTVQFISTQGPAEIRIDVLSMAKVNGEYAFRTSFPLSLTESNTIQLPAGVAYQIQATATQGQNGYVTVQVTAA